MQWSGHVMFLRSCSTGRLYSNACSRKHRDIDSLEFWPIATVSSFKIVNRFPWPLQLGEPFSFSVIFPRNVLSLRILKHRQSNVKNQSSEQTSIYFTVDHFEYGRVWCIAADKIIGCPRFTKDKCVRRKGRNRSVFTSEIAECPIPRELGTEQNRKVVRTAIISPLLQGYTVILVTCFIIYCICASRYPSPSLTITFSWCSVNFTVETIY